MTNRKHLYFVQCGNGGPIKIGVTDSPKTRMRTLQTACPYPLTLLYCREWFVGREAELHKRFAKYRTWGEWFLPAQEILAYVEHATEIDRLEAAGYFNEGAA